MCGRYYIDDELIDDLVSFVDRVNVDPKNAWTRDVYPGQSAPILQMDDGKTTLKDMKWGFPQKSGKGLFINARAETALTKPTFKDSVEHRRIIIPARHFYEWDKEKNKVTFYQGQEEPLYMAGFYNLFGEEDRYVILTTEANSSVEKVHKRMPLLLEKSEVTSWITKEEETEKYLKQVPGELSHRQDYEQQSLF